MEAVKTTTNAQTLTPAAEKAAQKKEGEQSMAPLFYQPKLTIGSPDDPLEKEADDMADKVMRMEMPSPINFSSAKNTVNRKCEHCEEEEKQLQRKETSNDSISVAPSIVHDVINSTAGKSLDGDTRAYMEPRFNYDFSNVKIHDNDLAAKSAGSINALAYTSGNNVVFNSGQYNTNSDSGKRLLAHELTHVVQQGNNIAAKIQRLGDLSKVPPMVCDVANTSSAGTVGFTALFPTSSTTLSPAQRSDIAIFVTSWQASGGTDVLRVDGYASTPGGDEMNWRLSCDRAFSVANELDINGVPRSMVEFFAQGETDEFGGQLDNQRANITILAAAPTPTPPAPTPPAPTPPAPTPVPTLNRTVTTPPASTGCGGFVMASRFGLDNATASTNGFIVQKLTFDLNRQICTGGTNNFSKTYWEAWQVRNGDVFIGTSADRHNADTFRVGSTPDQKGINFEQGKAKYIDGYTAPNSWGNVPEALSLPSTEVQPAGWSDSGTIDRWIKSEFDCCATPNTESFTHQA